MADTVFLLSSLITENFDKTFKKKFLSKYRLYTSYERSGKRYNIFVQENIQNGKIEIDDLAGALYDDLLYGNQRLIRLYKICSFDKKMQSQDELLSCLQGYYPYVETLDFNKILFQVADDEIDDLVGIKITVGINPSKIQKLNMIFSERCTVSDQNGQHDEYSYITVDVDFVKKELFIKVKPKTGVLQEDKKPTILMQRYFEKVTRMFNMNYHDYISIHKSTLCNMNIDLYTQIYNKMVKTRPSKMDEYVINVADEIIKKLQISNYQIKVAENNIFNIRDILKKMVEHVLISDIIYESKVEGTLEGVDGYVTYIKFNDGTNISARLRSKQSIEPIFSSEAFMALRSSIESAQQISELKIYWLNKFSGLRVSYNAMDSQCLEVLIYRHHKKEEFEYAIARYKECEHQTIGQNPDLLSLEA